MAFALQQSDLESIASVRGWSAFAISDVAHVIFEETNG
jgi:hypothetical protein